MSPSYTELNQEVMECQRALAALQESEACFRSAFDCAAIGIGLASFSGRWLKVNRALGDIVGYSEQELLRMDFQDLTYPDDLESDLSHIDELMAGLLRSYHLEKRYLHKNGHPVWVLLSVSLVRSANGKPLYLIKQVQDITERKQIEDELKSTATELARSNAELEQFAYIASHDLQEPLRMVASYLQLLARRYRGKLDADADEFIDYAVDGAVRMQRLINDLLVYSRAGMRGKAFKPIDCESVLKESLANLSMAIAETHAEITHDRLPVVWGDAKQLVQLFQNLIGNAIKFHGKKPPRIHISAEQKGAEWLFSVRDNGIGIEPQYFERIFAIFQRLCSRTDYPGTGIGLALCKKIAERHGGRIWAESEPGEGSTFYFTIPLTRIQSHE